MVWANEHAESNSVGDVQEEKIASVFSRGPWIHRQVEIYVQ